MLRKMEELHHAESNIKWSIGSFKGKREFLQVILPNTQTNNVACDLLLEGSPPTGNFHCADSAGLRTSEAEANRDTEGTALATVEEAAGEEQAEDQAVSAGRTQTFRAHHQALSLASGQGAEFNSQRQQMENRSCGNHMVMGTGGGRGTVREYVEGLLAGIVEAAINEIRAGQGDFLLSDSELVLFSSEDSMFVKEKVNKVDKDIKTRSCLSELLTKVLSAI